MSDWISVEDRLPDGDVVLGVVSGRGTKIVLSTFRRGNKWIGCGSFSDLGKVTHWMPLPEPPKE